MKAVALTALVIAAALAVPAFAQDKMDSMKGMNMPAMPASTAQATHSATGIVKDAARQARGRQEGRL